jgi:hypothetical protein
MILAHHATILHSRFLSRAADLRGPINGRLLEKIPGGPAEKGQKYEFHFFSFAAPRRTPRPRQALRIPAKSKRRDLAE